MLDSHPEIPISQGVSEEAYIEGDHIQAMEVDVQMNIVDHNQSTRRDVQRPPVRISERLREQGGNYTRVYTRAPTL